MSINCSIYQILTAQPVMREHTGNVEYQLRKLSAADLRFVNAAIKKLGPDAPRVTNIFRTERAFRGRVRELIARAGGRRELKKTMKPEHAEMQSA